MLIIWHPKTQEGTIHDFTHYGYMLYFTNLKGTIKYNSVTDDYSFSIRGPGRGTIKPGAYDSIPDLTAFSGEVWGYYNGVLTPIDPANPMIASSSIADWSASMRYHT
jgi:hypothetical protein